jgi:hypothetical protein
VAFATILDANVPFVTNQQLLGNNVDEDDRKAAVFVPSKI